MHTMKSISAIITALPRNGQPRATETTILYLQYVYLPYLDAVTTKPRSKEHDSFLKEWINQKDTFVGELLRLDGLRGTEASCGVCNAADASLYRCSECVGSRLLCATCCVAEHIRLPFHVIEVRCFQLDASILA